jgi:hypothetical protein
LRRYERLVGLSATQAPAPSNWSLIVKPVDSASAISSTSSRVVASHRSISWRADGDLTDLALSVRRCPLRRVSLDDHAPVITNVPAANGEKLETSVRGHAVDEMAESQHDIEPFCQVEGPDISYDSRWSMDVRKHLGRVVDGDDSVAAGGERISQPSDTSTEIEYRASLADDRPDNLQVGISEQRQVDLDRASRPAKPRSFGWRLRRHD